MTISVEEQFALDVLDFMPVITAAQQLVFLQEAVKQIDKIMPEKLSSNEVLTSFTVIHHSETYIFRGSWGEDTHLESLPPLPEKLYYRDRYKCLTNTQEVAGLVDNALCSIIPKFGLAGALVFIENAWKEKMLFDLELTLQYYWLLLRAELLQLSYPEAYQEYEEAKQALKAEGDSGTELDKIAQYLGKSNSHRWLYPILVYLENEKEHLEADLRKFNQQSSLSSWITRLRSLTLRTKAFYLMAWEGSFYHNEDKRHLRNLQNYFLARYNELKTLIRNPLSRSIYFDIIGAVNPNLQKRALDYHYYELLHIPHIIYEQVLKLIEAQNLNFAALETYVMSTMLNPGHEWGYEQLKS
jgi:hypothetical protein